MDKILIINNDADTMSLLKTWLEKKSYSVKYTTDSENALAMVKDFNPSLLIIDIMQSQVIEDIKNDPESRHFPILLMTGYTMRRNASGLPVDDIIEKPFDLDLLNNKIKKLIDNYNNLMQKNA